MLFAGWMVLTVLVALGSDGVGRQADLFPSQDEIGSKERSRVVQHVGLDTSVLVKLSKPYRSYHRIYLILSHAQRSSHILPSIHSPERHLNPLHPHPPSTNPQPLKHK